MAEKPDPGPKPQDKAKQPTEEQPKTPRKTTFFRRFLTRKWIAIIVGISIIIHGMGFTYYQFVKGATAAEAGPEVDLGAFQFKANPDEGGRVVNARFSLAIALLEKVDRPARERLKTHEFRVRQNVEELLRQAHSGDFDDPTLGGLKRRLQEQINATIGIRAISDVVITNLQLQHTDRDVEPVTDTAENVPWVDEPAS